MQAHDNTKCVKKKMQAHISFFNASGAEQIRLRLDDMGGPSLTLSDDAGLTLFETDPQ